MTGGDRVFEKGGCIVRLVGGQYDSTEYPTGWIADIWGAGTDDVWAVGDATEHFDGTGWTTVPIGIATPGAWLLGVYGTGPGNIWAVGRQGETVSNITGAILRSDKDFRERFVDVEASQQRQAIVERIAELREEHRSTPTRTDARSSVEILRELRGPLGED